MTMALKIRFISEYWLYTRLLKLIATITIYITTSLTYLQIVHAIPKPTYLIHHLGSWQHILTPPQQVDLEVVPFTLAFKPQSRTSTDVVFIITGCIFLLTSVFQLLTQSRSLGSTFLLPLGVLCSTSLSFLFALRIAIALNIPIHPTPLAHAFPFLVAIIGFDKPLRLARAAFHTRLPCILFYCSCHTPHLGSPVLSILIDSLASAYPPIIRDSFFEITLLASAAYLPIGALRQLCTLAALALTVHCLLLSSYFVFVLSEMLSIRILKLPKDIKDVIANSISPPPYRLPLSFLLGEKGPSLYNPHLKYTIESTDLAVTISHPNSEKQIPKNPSRLKLLIFTSFLLFNFITPFTPFTLSHHPINPSTSISNINRTIPDISDPSISAILNALTHPETGTDLYIKLHPQPSSPHSFFSSYSILSHDFSSPISISISLSRPFSSRIFISLSRSFPFLSFTFSGGQDDSTTVTDQLTLSSPFLSFTFSGGQDSTTVTDQLTLSISILIILALNLLLLLFLLLYLLSAILCLKTFMTDRIKQLQEVLDQEKAKNLK